MKDRHLLIYTHEYLWISASSWMLNRTVVHNSKKCLQRVARSLELQSHGEATQMFSLPLLKPGSSVRTVAEEWICLMASIPVSVAGNGSRKAVCQILN